VAQVGSRRQVVPGGTVGAMAVTDDGSTNLAFDCPRCRRPVEAPYYGPCEVCLGELRLRYQAERTEVAQVAYEPKMNVTPNAVALKDD